MASQRWATFDDTSGSVKYSGPWTVESGQNWNQGNFGLPFNNGLHSIKGARGSLSFAYDGTNGRVYGTNNVKNTNSGVQDPSWTCQIDGVSINSANPASSVENNWILCEWAGIPAGKHTVTITATSASQAFLFDRFQYIPSPNADITNANIIANYDDPAIQYGSGWQDLGDPIGRMAPDAGAVISFQFYGTGIAWYGTAPAQLPHGATTAEYTIDGGSPTTFTVPGTSGDNQFFQRLFQTGSLSLGHHALEVTSRGKTSLTPLVLSGLVITGGSVQEPATPPAPASTPVPGEGVAVPAGSDPSATTSIPGAPALTGSAPMTIITTGVGGSRTTIIVQSNSTTTLANMPNANGTVGASGSTTAAQNAATTSGTTPDGTTSGSDGMTSANENGSKHGTPIGAIVGGVVGSVVIVLICFLLSLLRKRRAQERNKVLEAKPFYRDDAESPQWLSQSISAHPGGAQQMSQTGNSRAVLTKHTEAHAENPPLGVPILVSSPGTPEASTSNHTPRPSSISNNSEASVPNSTGSAAPLLFPNRAENSGAGTSKFHEHLQSSSSPNSSGGSGGGGSAVPRVINHQDSGYRIPCSETLPPPPEGSVIEYPPEYTAS